MREFKYYECLERVGCGLDQEAREGFPKKIILDMYRIRVIQVKMMKEELSREREPKDKAPVVERSKTGRGD